jgi:hypothetical protein
METNMKRIIPFHLTLMLLAACAPSADNPDQPVISDAPTAPMKFDNTIPRPQDKDLLQQNAYITSTDLLTMESFPLQFTLVINGDLPTPCNQLRVDVKEPDAENKIVVDVYSVIAADMMCTEVLQPFSENVSLGSFPTGHYTLWINGEKVAEFDA